jgi:hypothetical protein
VLWTRLSFDGHKRTKIKCFEVSLDVFPFPGNLVSLSASAIDFRFRLLPFAFGEGMELRVVTGAVDDRSFRNLPGDVMCTRFERASTPAAS